LSQESRLTVVTIQLNYCS